MSSSLSNCQTASTCRRSVSTAPIASRIAYRRFTTVWVRYGDRITVDPYDLAFSN